MLSPVELDDVTLMAAGLRQNLRLGQQGGGGHVAVVQRARGLLGVPSAQPLHLLQQLCHARRVPRQPSHPPVHQHQIAHPPVNNIY